MENLRQQIDNIEEFVLKEHPGLDDIILVRWSADFRKKMVALRAACDRAEAHLDPLSGLPTRVIGEKAISDLDNTRNRVGKNRTYSVVFVDIDNLKKTNDTFGHAVGDLLIQLMGKAIRRSIRPMDQAFRWGGDEFVIILDSLNPGEAIRSVIERIQETAPPASYGSAHIRHHHTIQSAIASADFYMYKEKKAKGLQDAADK